MSSSFWEMGGYAVYVWSSFGVAVAAGLWNLLMPRLQRRQILKQLAERDE